MANVFKYRANTRLVHLDWKLKENLTDKTLVIYDEADRWWMDMNHDIAEAKYVIGVSATSYKDHGATEAVYLESIGVKIIDSKIESRIGARQVETVSSIVEFAKSRAMLCKPGFLIYVNRGEP